MNAINSYWYDRVLLRLLLAIQLCAALLVLTTGPAWSQILSDEALAAKVEPPYELGDPLGEDGVWSIRDRTGIDAGYIFETGPLAPLPGFAGVPIHVLVTMDADGRFLRAELLDHNEPIFVSGLGQAPFHEFMRQYRGLSVFDPITVGVPYGAGNRDATAAVYLDGVTKATASVRIAHESILAASLEVARRHMKGLAGGPAPSPLKDGEPIVWEDLVRDGLAHRFSLSNADVQAAFAGSLWEDDDAEATTDPDGVFLDLWIIDVGPRAIAAGVLDAETLAERDQLMSIATHDEPLLLLANGRHGLVSEEFVRNTRARSVVRTAGRAARCPARRRHRHRHRHQSGGRRAGLRASDDAADRPAGWDLTRPDRGELQIRAVRQHGMFMPETGTRDFVTTQSMPERFYRQPQVIVSRPVWVESMLDRMTDLAALGLFLAILMLILIRALRRLAILPGYRAVRLAVLAFVIVFIGWWGQGQLSIVTVTGALRTALDGASFEFLLYDPFSLLIWGAVIASLIVWGRGFFCGWLCPYGAMQELSHALGRAIGAPEFRVPDRWDRTLKQVKYAVLAALITCAVFAPAWNDALAEVEPFKTAVTTGFDREWWFVVYAAGWIVLGMFVFKTFCRYICPLGAFLALAGIVRRTDWIPRRPGCGSPCHLCKVRCNYNAIDRSGRIEYDECFQCLDCVTIHEDKTQCVPLILAARRNARSSDRLAGERG